MILQVSSVVLMAVIVAGCKSPTSPLQHIPRGRTDNVISGIQIVGPHTLAPTESAQFRVIVTMSDGMVRDLTSVARWSNIGDQHLIMVSGDGMVTALQTGDGSIAASIEGHRPVAGIIVVPRGTYRLVGSVMEPGHSAVPDALVEVIPRSGARQSTRTNHLGAYSVHGVSGEIELRVTLEGYVPFSRRLDVTFHQNYSVELTLQ
jgi:Carboxypeptidase regulatory-like domain